MNPRKMMELARMQQEFKEKSSQSISIPKGSLRKGNAGGKHYRYLCDNASRRGAADQYES